jgi:hypothetical protein
VAAAVAVSSGIVFEIVIVIIFKFFFILKYIKIIIFYFLKIIFKINTFIYNKNKNKN